jgi:hypothetical protein
VAVFPSRIRLKETTDSSATISAAIGTGGSDPIVAGEIVIGREAGAAKLYTLDSTGAVVKAGGEVASVNGQIGAVSLTLEDLTDVQDAESPSDSNFSSISFLARCNSYPFTNLSLNGLAPVSSGITSVSSAQSKFGGFSALFAATNQYLRTATSTTYSLASGQDVTYECWFRYAAVTAVRRLIFGAVSNEWNVVLDQADGHLSYWNGAERIAGSIPAINTWHHVALVRQSGVISLYLNGTRVGTHSTMPTQSTNQITFGGRTDNTWGFNGWLDDLRITSGLARYSGATLTVPTLTFPLGAPSAKQTLVWNGNQWIFSGAESAFSRSTASITSSILSINSSENLALTGTGKAGEFLSITVSHACWVVFYSDQTSRTADASRLQTTDPDPGSGVLLEVVSTGAQTALVTPSASYFNSESTPLSEIYVRVKNLSGAANAITITASILASEG